MLFVLPLLSANPPQDLDLRIESYPKRDAAESAVALFRLLPRLEGTKRDAVRFLLATDLAELGLHDPSVTLYRSLVASAPALAPA
ncbi:MAG: hypothetical protein ACREQ9_01740, partial [Candidatus Binatia bacterium]